MFVLTLVLVGLAMRASVSGLAGWLGLGAFALHLGWQVAILRREDPIQALRLFRANRDAGLILFAGLMVDAGIARLF